MRRYWMIMQSPRPKPRQSCPLETAGWFSRFFFCWLNALFSTGYKRSLSIDDLYEIVPDDSSDWLCRQLEVEWYKEIKVINKEQQPSMWRAIWRAFGWHFVLTGALLLIEECTKVVRPILFGGLVRYFVANSTVTQVDAYLYATGISLCAFLECLLDSPYCFYAARLGMWLHAATCALIYKKVLRLHSSVLVSMSPGYVVNLISNDITKFNKLPFIHYLWLSPIQAIVILTLLWTELGVACLAGFLFIFLILPLQALLGNIYVKLSYVIATITDKRISVMNEIISGIKVIKMYCWESMFIDIVRALRRQEMKKLWQVGSLKGGVQAVIIGSSRVIALVTFVAYVGAGGNMSAEKVFKVIPLYIPLQINMMVYLPWAVQFLAESVVGIRRLQNFLLLKELEEDLMKLSNRSLRYGSQRPVTSRPLISVSDLSASWNNEEGKDTFRNVNFAVFGSELLCVIGPVGAGKTSLLLALLGEMPTRKGHIVTNGAIVYVSQQPWILPCTLRDNITFGQPFDQQSYDVVIMATALAKDIAALPQGDQTVVGEHGMRLSGGQRARVSLARAVYCDAEVYLLDDPLSAQDAAVGKHIFEKCICGLLRKKVRVLVTNRLQCLDKASSILVMNKGEVVSVGLYSELSASGIDIKSFLQEDNVKVDFALDRASSNRSLLSLTRRKSDSDLSVRRFANKASGLYSGPRSHDSISMSLTSVTAPRHRRSFHSLMKSSVPVENTVDINAELTSVSLGSVNANISTDTQPLAAVKKGVDSAPSRDSREVQRRGSVSWRVYWSYFSLGACVPGLILLLIVNVAALAVSILSDWWLSEWANKEEESVTVDRWYYVGIYAAIVVSTMALTVIGALSLFYTLIAVARRLHWAMFKSVIRCPTLFFDTTPTGQILNRFSKDMMQIDEVLPPHIYDFLQSALVVIGSAVVAVVIDPWVVLALVPLVVVIVAVRQYYMGAARDLRRLLAITRSPVFSHFTATMTGLLTIRAYKAQVSFTRQYFDLQDADTSAWFLFLSAGRWLAIRLDLLCALFVTIITFSCIFYVNNLNAGLVGLTLTYTLSFVGMFQWTVRHSAEIENQMVSVERVLEYTQLPGESASAGQGQCSPDWPSAGAITATNVFFQYSDASPVILHNLNFAIRGGEKIGVVGRTGAGKSSLVAMLYRLAEPTGIVDIDGVNICCLPLGVLRKKLSIIPQDPYMFSGTLRSNLDPFGEHTDTEILAALEEATVKTLVAGLPAGLAFEVTEGGKNFSVGQRQLLCLTRALLQSNRIMILDEAIANVDTVTDEFIVSMLTRKLRDCTVIMIAHQLKMVMGMDRIMVLDRGRIVEFDEPLTLLEDSHSLLYELVDSVQPADRQQLVALAKVAYDLRHPSHNT